MTKQVNKNIELNEFRREYNSLRSRAIAQNITNLSVLSDYELFLWIIANTLNYGRDFKSSVNNALSHLEDRQNAIKVFSTSENDLIGGIK
jgi:hypothetical protein